MIQIIQHQVLTSNIRSKNLTIVVVVVVVVVVYYYTLEIHQA